jgi:hypothetical protein
MKTILIILLLIALSIGSYCLVYKNLPERTVDEDDFSRTRTNDKSRQGVKIIENIQNESYKLAEEASK